MTPFGCLLSLFLLLTVFTEASAEDQKCPADVVYNARFDQRYRYVNAHESFLNAEQTCIKLGGHLASASSLIENAVLVQGAMDHLTCSSVTEFWIGGNNFEKTKNWTWTDGSAITYSNWANGYPTNENGNNCLAIEIKETKWINTNCFSSKTFVCEIPKVSVMTCPVCPAAQSATCPSCLICSTTTTATCPICPTTMPVVPSTCEPPNLKCPSGWTYFAKADSCYYQAHFNSSWDHAEAYCLSQGAHLTSIHSYEEQEFIVCEYFAMEKRASAVASTSDMDKSRAMTWIGLRLLTETQYKWTDNSPVDYTNWAKTWPIIGDRNYRCTQLIIYSSSQADAYRKWTNNWCVIREQKVSVCKKPAK